jgi:hypothetical protein
MNNISSIERDCPVRFVWLEVDNLFEKEKTTLKVCTVEKIAVAE